MKRKFLITIEIIKDIQMIKQTRLQNFRLALPDRPLVEFHYLGWCMWSELKSFRGILKLEK